jgi:hypothetical protein
MNIAELRALVGAGHRETFARRLELARGGWGGLPDGGVSPELRAATACLTLLAGAGTRWVRTLSAAKSRVGSSPRDEFERAVAAFPLEAPRGLFPVRNFIERGGPRVPLAAYAIDAFRRLGRQVIVVRGWEAEIRAEVLGALGMAPGDARFCMQREGPSGKVLGHGDAARQARPLWEGSRYVMTNFGGDANSPLTAALALQALAALDAAGEDVALVIPVASILNSAYPIRLDGEGFPRAFGHDKLGGAGSSAAGTGVSGDGYAYTNVGIRVYRTADLAAAIEEVEEKYWDPKIGYSIPGNDPGGREFALDNIDALLAERGKARILAVANPEELTPAKSFDEIEHFEEATEKVRAEWDAFLAGSKS